MLKRIAILGSTGSIGRNALRVIKALGPDYRVVALTAHNNAELLAEQVRKFAPDVAAVSNPDSFAQFRAAIGSLPCRMIAGAEAMEEIASLDEVDIVLTAVVGAAGLAAVLKAVRHGKTVAIANKEPLVMAGALLTETAKETGARILPIDSEHSAVFQAMQAGNRSEVKRIILTASGGPFRRATAQQLDNATLQEALAHPTWDMGPKITVDSATMMNKALELIEAVWLFDMPPENIDILIHPESVIHSMVEYIDGSVIAQMGTPDMTVPIQYALTWPRRCKGIAPGLNFEQLAKLTFEKPDMELFRAISLGYEVAAQGGSAPVVFNAANEAAVEQFLAGRIKFTRIVELVEYCLGKHNVKTSLSLEELLEVDAWARRTAYQQSARKVVH